ncbi:MAG: hypothetical protein PHF29_08340 [Candidatus Riflebacteria bacterium]|nr:hypothetical protein [Candidatus Riflebacteria bacterium]
MCNRPVLLLEAKVISFNEVIVVSEPEKKAEHTSKNAKINISDITSLNH